MENTSACWEATTVMTDYVSRLQVCPLCERNSEELVYCHCSANNLELQKVICVKKELINVFFFYDPFKISISVTQKLPFFVNSGHITISRQSSLKQKLISEASDPKDGMSASKRLSA